MNRKELVSHRNLKDESGKTFTVEYYVTVDSSKLEEPEPAYGVLIEKFDLESPESYEASCCFHEYGPAFAIAEKLSRYSVTPSGAEETIESLLEYINR